MSGQLAGASASALGFTQNIHTITLYVEGVTENLNTQTLEDVRENGKPTTSIILNVYPAGNVADGPVVSDRVNYLVANSTSFFYYLLKNEDLRLAFASDEIYDRNDLRQFCMEPLTREQLVTLGIDDNAVNGDVSNVENLTRDNSTTGFAAGVYHDYISGKNIVTFQGTDATSFDDWYNNFKQALGHKTKQYDAATRIGADLRDNWRTFRPGVDILINPTAPAAWVITGHSLGGGLASAASLVSNVRAATFNAAGLHANTLQPFLPRITDAQMHQVAQGLITAYVVDWDILNNLQDAGDITVDILVDVPTAVGTRVTLDSDLDLEVATGTFKVLVGAVTLIAGGAGTTTTIEGVVEILTAMVQAHSVYAESLYAYIDNH